MEKNTTKILEELRGCSDFKKFYSENAEFISDKTLADYLADLMEKKQLKKPDVIRKSEMSEVYAYQIFSGIRVPERNKLLCLARGMGLNLAETQRLLKCTGYSQLYVKKEFDSIIIYGICKKLSVAQINELLYEYDLDTIG